MSERYLIVWVLTLYKWSSTGQTSAAVTGSEVVETNQHNIDSVVAKLERALKDSHDDFDVSVTYTSL